MQKIYPGAVIGIIGGGQLGKMLAAAAAEQGYKVIIFTDKQDCPAALVTSQLFVADYNDHDSIVKFANMVDIVTFEFENIPYKTVSFIEEKVQVSPNAKSLYVSQNRIREKNFINTLGIKTAEYHAVNNKDDLRLAFESFSGQPAILKTAEFGYDGKGQFNINSYQDIDNIIFSLSDEYVLEKKVSFSQEISVIVARSSNGEVKNFPPVTNIHKNGILDISLYPANIDENLQQQAVDNATKIALGLDLVGLLAVEFFVVDNKLLVNEIAPRPHNSGHWTMDACYTDQFEQHIRAICGLPLSSTKALVANAKMINLIGDDVNNIEIFLTNPLAKLHVYGKTSISPGRKMGHVNIISY